MRLDHIFEPFFTTRPDGKGTGLGLTAVYGTVKEHHGAILVESKLGEGTAFRLYFPVCDVSDTTVPTDSATSAPPHFSGNVLLVDDEKTLRSAVHIMLEEAGLTVTEAANGKEAIAIFTKDPQCFDLVLMDVVMPDVDGETCFYTMIKLNPEAKIILMSGFSGRASLPALQKAGLLAMLRKPFRREDLFRQLALYLKHS